MPSSGVGLLALSSSEFPAQVRLYYQIGSGNMVEADWISVAQFQAGGEFEVSPILMFSLTDYHQQVTVQPSLDGISKRVSLSENFLLRLQ